MACWRWCRSRRCGSGSRCGRRCRSRRGPGGSRTTLLEEQWGVASSWCCCWSRWRAGAGAAAARRQPSSDRIVARVCTARRGEPSGRPGRAGLPSSGGSPTACVDRARRRRRAGRRRVASRSAFHVHLDVFDGPFDLLLSLIAKRRLDVTLVAIAQVTDEFLGYIRHRGEDWDLDQASEFLVVAATLLDLKVARLLPSAEVDEEDLALLEARDLLFARLLQYRAYKEVAALFAEQMAAAAQRFPRDVGLEPQFARSAARGRPGRRRRASSPSSPRAPRCRARSRWSTSAHLHAPVVSVREQAAILAARLRVGRGSDASGR